MFSMFKPSENPASTATADAPARRSVAPRVDILETAEAVVLVADMPGVAQDGVEVTVDGGVLTLRGRTAARPQARALWQETAERDFARAFRLGQDVDPERITARIKDGVLRVELGKRQSAKARRIAVN